MAPPVPPSDRPHPRRPFRHRLAVPGIALTAAVTGLLALPSSAGASPAAHPASSNALVSDPASLANPLIGTSNAADDFPGADVPFGMVQWSPDTPSRPDGGGYEYNDSSITGFSLTHIAGPGCGAAGDIPVLPTVGAVSGSATDSFSHSNESANAGDYKVALANGGTAELTVTARTGMADFTFPASSAANLIFKLDASQNGDSATSWSVVSNTEVQGSATSGNFCGAGNTYTVYFDMQFSQPFSSSGTLSSTNAVAGIDHVSGGAEKANHPVYHGALAKGQTGAGAKAQARTKAQAQAQATPALTGPAGSYLTFNTTGNQTVLAKVGVSYVSMANAKANLTSENPGFNFATTQSAAHSAWNSVLGRIGISGGTSAQQAQFYTALYHSLLHPNVFSDANGQYKGVDGKGHTVDRR